MTGRCKDNPVGVDFTPLIDEGVGRDVDYEALCTETRETDILVVGAGAAGLPAAIEALNLGRRVIVLEHNRRPGGSGQMCFGILGVNSPLQREQNVHVSIGEIARIELANFGYRLDGAWLVDMLRASGENVAWLMENGVTFSGIVNTYMTDGHVRTYHPFGPREGGAQFIQALVRAVETRGGEIRTETSARRLILDEEGKVRGLYARDGEGKIHRYLARAVILATGGYENNDALLAARGYDPAHLVFRGFPGHDGSGFFMALDAGGANWLDRSSLNESPTNRNLKYHNGEYLDLWVGLQGRQIVVNGLGERIMDETAPCRVRGYGVNAIRAQGKLPVYEIYDGDVLEAAVAHAKRNSPGRYEHIRVMIQESAAEGCETVWKADSIEELARKTGLPEGRLRETLESYNRYAEQGEDEEFGKPKEELWPIRPPYYCMQYTDIQFIHCNGAVHTGRNSEVLDEREKPVPGLYAVGTLGAEFWQGFYTMSVPGGCMAFNVYSARKAARHAAAAHP